MELLKYILRLFVWSLILFIVATWLGCSEQQNIAPVTHTTMVAQEGISISSRFGVQSVKHVEVPGRSPNLNIYTIKDKIGSNDFIVITTANGHVTSQPIGRVNEQLER